MMCGEEGFCLYRHFRSELAFRDVPVIMLSSLSRDILFRFRSQAVAFGGREAPEPEAFLRSPPDIGELVDTVARLTGSRASSAIESASSDEAVEASSSEPSADPSTSSP
jgi:hypothetical protein